MAIRNFWIEANVDGYKYDLAGGPRQKTGGLVATVFQREKGDIKTAVTISCQAHEQRLTTRVYVGDKVLEVETER